MADRSASVNFDRIADDYDATRGGTGRGSVIAAELTALLEPYPARVPLLEIGVGTGIVAQPLTAAGRDVVGFDLSARMLRHAFARLGPRVARADAGRLPLADASVPVAYSVWVLHLVADVAEVLAEVARVLAPSGVYAVVCSRGYRHDATDTEALNRRLHDALDAPQGRQDSPDRLAQLGRPAGLSARETRWVRAEAFAATPNDDADRLQARAWSALWDLDDAAWVRHVQPVIDELRALPEPNRAREHPVEHAVVVLTKA